MAKLLKLRRGTTTQHSSFTGAEGEVTVDTDKDVLVVHDGSTAGGHPVAAQDMDNVPAGAILGTQLENSGVTAGQYGSSSAIPIVTVDAQGLVTAASTTAIDSTTIANGTSNVAVANNGDITATRSGTARLVVDNNGVDVTGVLNLSDNLDMPDNAKIIVGNGDDLKIFHDGNNSVIREDGTGDLYLQNGTSNILRIQSTGTQITGNLDVSSGVDVTGNITVSGTVDGADVAAMNTKLSGIEAGAEVNLTNAEVKSAYEANSNTNAFTDAKQTILAGLSTSTGTLVDGVQAQTKPTSNNGNAVATTSFVRSAITAYNFPSGTKMLFQQTSAPTGWTKVTSGVNNKALRVVSGSAGSGGNVAFTTVFAARGITANAGNTTQGGNISVANTTAGGNVSISSVSTSGTVNSHTLSTNEMPSHYHNINGNKHGNYYGWEANHSGIYGLNNRSYDNQGTNYRTSTNAGRVESTGGGGGHSHGFTGSSHTHNGSLSGTAHNHNATFSGSAHNHSITVSNLDMQAEYLDVIIAEKD